MDECACAGSTCVALHRCAGGAQGQRESGLARFLQASHDERVTPLEAIPQCHESACAGSECVTLPCESVPVASKGQCDSGTRTQFAGHCVSSGTCYDRIAKLFAACVH